MSDSEFCEGCGASLSTGLCPHCQKGESSRLIHRDIFLLAAIAAIAIAIFLFTRAMAAKERQLSRHVAAVWFQEGKRQLAAGHVGEAVNAFRRATGNNYEDREYGLTLANALGLAGHTEEARYALLRLRGAAPENAQVNLDLARLAARRDDVAEATRYYHNALYGLWTGSEVDRKQREVRIELIRFLLRHRQRTQGLSELLILENDLPNEGGAQTEIGELYLAADDASHALKHFVRAEHLDRHNQAALAGAGEAAFRLGDYVRAQRYLEAAQAEREAASVQRLLSLTKLVLSQDPLLPRLTPQQRSTRLESILRQSIRRLDSCILQSQANRSAVTEMNHLREEVMAVLAKQKHRGLHRDSELLESGVDLMAQSEESCKRFCGEPEELDLALLLVGQHKGAIP